MNFKLTFAMIYLFVLAAAGFAKIIHIFAKNPREIWRNFFAKSSAFWLVSAFVSLNEFSVFWSENRARALMTFALIFCLYLVFIALILTQDFAKKLIKSLTKIYVLTAVIMGIFVLGQFIYGTFFVRGFLLCAGCVSGQFGFVRPNVFAIEPQFFGSLLLPVILVIFREILVRKNRFSRNILFGFLLVILLLTLSRGAIFAFVFGAIFVMIFSRKSVEKSSKSLSEISRKAYIKNFAKSVLIGAFALLLTLVFQGLAAEINPNIRIDFGSAINSSLNQLSMGIIKIRENKPQENPQKISQNSVQKTETKTEKIPAFSGYVAESTDVRTGLTKLAFDTWKAGNFREKSLGFGLGSSGIAMANFAKNGDQKEIVQNEFVEILLELGVVGAAIFAAILFGLIREIWRNKNGKWTLGILIALAFQWLFFSGYPSAIHIYLTLVVLYIFAKTSPRIPVKNS
jgi:hypothetical protein